MITVSKEMAVAIASSQPELSMEQQKDMINALLGESISGKLDTLTKLIIGTIQNSTDLETAEQNLLFAQSSIRAAANVINHLI